MKEIFFNHPFAVTTSLACFTLALFYKVLKQPKQDVNVVRQMVFRGDRPLIFGHRGGQYEGPENTIAAVKNAVRNGASAIEIDLEFTQDGVPVIFHDDDIDRVSNGTGPIKSYTYEQLKKFNMAHSQPYVINKDGYSPVKFETIPTLDDMVELCMKENILINLDVKSNATKTVQALNNLSQKYPNITNYMIVTSFHPTIVYSVRAQCPEFLVGLIWRYNFLSLTITDERRYSFFKHVFLSLLDKVFEISVHTWLPDFLGISLLSMHKRHLSEKYVADFRGNGFEVMTWTVNNAKEKNYFLERLEIPIITDSILNSESCKDQVD